MAPPLMSLYWQQIGWVGKQPHPDANSTNGRGIINYG
jgi:hypothetical protein